MKRALTKGKKVLYYYQDNQRFKGVPSGLRGNISSRLRGNISPELRGDISGIWGDISPRLRGDIDECELTAEERQQGVNIADLLKEEK